MGVLSGFFESYLRGTISISHRPCKAVNSLDKMDKCITFGHALTIYIMNVRRHDPSGQKDNVACSSYRRCLVASLEVCV